MGGEEPATYVTSYLSYGWVAERKRRAKIVNGMEQKPQGYWMYYPYYYADPIPSFSFCSGRKNTSHPCKIETGFLCGDSARVIRFFAGVIQQLGLWTQKTSGAAPRALRSALDSHHPSLRSDASLAAKRRAEALHVAFFFNKASEPSTMSCCSVCTLA